MRIQVPCMSLVRLQLIDHCVIGEVLDDLYQDNGTWKNANGNEKFSILPTWVTPGRPTASCIGFELSQIVDLVPLQFPDGQQKFVQPSSACAPLPNNEQLGTRGALKSGPQVSDLSLLHFCHSLSLLRLESVPINDLEPLREVQDTLQSLYIIDMCVTDLEAVTTLHQLTELHLIDLPVTQIPIPNFGKLNKLAVSVCPVNELPPAKLCHPLETIDISRTKITSIMQLVACPNLKELNCWNTGVPEDERTEFAKRRPDVKLIG